MTKEPVYISVYAGTYPFTVIVRGFFLKLNFERNNEKVRKIRAEFW